MNETDRKISAWQTQGHRIATATLVKVYGSAPQPLGARMAVTEDFQVIGSVSGGCVESDVIEKAAKVIETREPRLVQYSIGDETAWGFGLACGGTIEVFIEPFQDIHARILEHQKENRLFGVLTVLTGSQTGKKEIVQPGNRHPLPQDSLLKYPPLVNAANEILKTQRSKKIDVRLENEDCQVFFELYSPPARLVIIGAVHIAMPLVELANVLGFRAIVIDPRPVFANRERFPSADELLVGWPADELEKLGIDENTYVVFVSHDDKFDVPALIAVLNSKARYIGALGSKTTHANRVTKLIEAGADPALIARIHAPIGLDIGASGAQEIALAIISEMVAVKNGKSLPGKP